MLIFLATLQIEHRSVRENMRIPKHIAVIPDGNRRWAANHKLEKQEGYDYGLEPGLKVLKKQYNMGLTRLRIMDSRKITASGRKYSKRHSKRHV